MQDQINVIRDMIEEVLDALNGNRITKKGGIVSRLDALEEKVEKIQKKTDRFEVYQRLLWTAAGVVSYGVFQEILKKL